MFCHENPTAPECIDPSIPRDTDGDTFNDTGGPDGDGSSSSGAGDGDNCPDMFNPSQRDSDSDGIGDACDSTPYGDFTDSDNDYIEDQNDNCPHHYNPSQSDTDLDGLGDACDGTPYGDVNPDPIDQDNDGCTVDVDPDDTDPAINCDPDDKDTDGDGWRDGVDPDPNDSTVTGSRDSQAPGYASGGFSCDAPPSCQGDQVQCAILFQTWKARCAGENFINGDIDNCATNFTCTGDPIQCMTLHHQREAACAGQEQGENLYGDMNSSFDALKESEGEAPTEEGELTDFEFDEVDIGAGISESLEVGALYTESCPDPQ